MAVVQPQGIQEQMIIRRMKSGDNDKAGLEIETGTASFYADEFDGKKTANGEVYNMNDLTAAHPSYCI